MPFPVYAISQTGKGMIVNEEFDFDKEFTDPDFHEEQGYFTLDKPVECLWCGMKATITELDRNGYNCKVLLPSGMTIATIWKGPDRSITFDDAEWQSLCQQRKEDHDRMVMLAILAQRGKKEEKNKKKKLTAIA